MPLSLDRFQAEVTGGAFTLTDDAGASITIKKPSNSALLASDANDSMLEVVANLCGDQAQALLAMVGREDFSVLQEVVRDLQEHFGLADVARLRWLLERYGDAIEADFHRYYRVDLLDFWRDKLSPRKVLNLIGFLPAHSAYAEAIGQDDEVYAEAVADAPAELDVEGAAYRPRITEWSPTEQLLAAVFNRLGELIVVTGGGGKLPDPWPVPETAAERAVKARQDHEWVVLADRIEQALERSRRGEQLPPGPAGDG